MEKRGQSEVITVVLIILVVLAAVIILYVVIMSLIKKGTNDIPPPDMLNDNVVVMRDASNFLTEPVKVTVTRGAGELEYSAIKIVFYSATKSYTETISQGLSPGLPLPLETKSYLIYLRTPPPAKIVNPISFSVYIVYKTSFGDKISPISDSFDERGVICAALQRNLTVRMGLGDITDCKGSSVDLNARYDLVVDFNNDRNINRADADIFNQNNGNEDWCAQQLNKQLNPCENHYCSVLLEIIAKNYLADPNCYVAGTCVKYCNVANNWCDGSDINGDGIVNVDDLGILATNSDDSEWCRTQLGQD